METQTERRRRQILACTFTRLAADGFGGTTAKKLAAEAGISDTLIFKYFQSLDNLYKEVLEARMRPLFSFSLPANAVSLNDFLVSYLQLFESEVLQQRAAEVRLYVATRVERPDLAGFLPDPEHSGAWMELAFRIREKRISRPDFKLQFLRGYLDGRLLQAAAGRNYSETLREDWVSLLDFFAM